MNVLDYIKNYSALLIGIVIGFGISLVFFLFFSDKDNSIRIIAALINGLVLILIAGYFNRSENSAVSLKNYFLSELAEFRNEYFDFTARVESGSLNKREIKTENKKLSMSAQQLLHVLKREFNINSEIITPISSILNIISGYDPLITGDRIAYFDNIDEDSLVNLSRQQEYLLAIKQKDLRLLLKNLAININKA